MDGRGIVQSPLLSHPDPKVNAKIRNKNNKLCTYLLLLVRHRQNIANLKPFVVQPKLDLEVSSEPTN